MTKGHSDTNRAIRLPDFFCIGAQKAGTTSLHDIFKQHPEIYLPEAKEAHFFDRDDRYSKGLEWWLSTFFNDYNGQKVVGTFTPDYIFFEEVPERLFESCGDNVKIILILRHPVDRAQSHYFMEKRRGFETLSFLDAIEYEDERISKGRYELDHFSYMKRGKYAEQIARYLQFVKKENFLLLSFENDIKSNLNQTIQRIESFLEIEMLDLNAEIQSNKAQQMKSARFHRIVIAKNPLKSILRKLLPKKMRMSMRKKLMELNFEDVPKEEKISAETRTALFQKYFEDEIDKIKTLTGVDFSYWRQNEN